jgi:hypothetical protein
MTVMKTKILRQLQTVSGDASRYTSSDASRDYAEEIMWKRRGV